MELRKDGSKVRFRHWIGGAAADSVDGATFATENPTTGKVWGHFALGRKGDVDRAVTAASDAFEGGAMRSLWV